MRILQNDFPEKFFIKWSDFIHAHPENTVFQSPEMYRFYCEVKNYHPDIFIAIDKNGNVCGVLLSVLIREGKGLKAYFSSRVVVYGGPLISEKVDCPKKRILDELLRAFVTTLKNKAIFLQFRNHFEWGKNEIEIFRKHGFVFENRLNLLVHTENENIFWSEISKTRKRQIKKILEKKDLCLTGPENEEDVFQFYRLLVDLYKQKVRKPLPDFSFFKAFYYATERGQLGVIRLVKKEQKVIGGILSPITQNRNIYEWYIVGLDKMYKADYPSIAATWSSIDYAIKNGLAYFDFMGLGVPEKAYGVREFKKRFGGTMVNFGRFFRRNNKFLYFIAKTGFRLSRLF